MRIASVVLFTLLAGCSAPVEPTSAPATASTAEELSGTYVASSAGTVDPTAIVAIQFLEGRHYGIWRNAGCTKEASNFTACDASETGTYARTEGKLSLHDDASGKTVTIDFAVEDDPWMVHPKTDLVTPGNAIGASVRLAGTDYQLLARQALPSFQKMWDAYPAMPSDPQAQAYIGGAVNAAWITNACTIRLSRALNYAGLVVPQGPAMASAGLHTVVGGDGMNYAFRVAEMRDYLVRTVGPPLITQTASPGRAGVDPSAFAGKKGIIAFTVPFSDATGHFDLWDGSKPAHAEYFSRATKVEFWETPP
jgi:hypothetical protein